jgi:uncharacterized membrane protein YdjX (TVP38/TMEM64 family)
MLHLQNTKQFLNKAVEKAKARKNLRNIIIGTLILALGILLYFSGIYSKLGVIVKTLFIKGLELTGSLGFWGPLFIIVIYVIASVLFLPGSVLTLGAGFLFKLVLGTITVSVGSTLGACAAFLVGRTIGRNWVAKKVSKSYKFKAIDEAVARQGFKIVLLTRLSPVFPFNMLNYAFGLTKISFWKYSLASWIGMLPGTVMYVYFGAGLRSLADVAAGKVEKGTAGRLFFWFGLAATVVVTIFVSRIAGKTLKQSVSYNNRTEV